MTSGLTERLELCFTQQPLETRRVMERQHVSQLLCIFGWAIDMSGPKGSLTTVQEIGTLAGETRHLPLQQRCRLKNHCGLAHFTR